MDKWWSMVFLDKYFFSCTVFLEILVPIQNLLLCLWNIGSLVARQFSWNWFPGSLLKVGWNTLFIRTESGICLFVCLFVGMMIQMMK